MKGTLAWLLLLALAGGLLRIGLLVAAEHELGTDEAVVGIMAMDVLERRARPMFVYLEELDTEHLDAAPQRGNNAYDGGSAFEAHLGALAFAALGPSAVALKLVLLGIWGLTALLLADLCARALPRLEALLTLGFFSLGRC